MEWNHLRGTVKHLCEEGNSRAETDDDHDRSWHFNTDCRRAMAQDAGVTGNTRELDEYGFGKIDFDSPVPPANFIYGRRTKAALNKWTEWVNSLPQKQKPRGWFGKLFDRIAKRLPKHIKIMLPR